MRAAQLSPGSSDRMCVPHMCVPIPNQIPPGFPQRCPKNQRAKQKGKLKLTRAARGPCKRTWDESSKEQNLFGATFDMEKEIKTTWSTEELKLMNETTLIV